MKILNYLTILVRVLVGALFIFASVNYFFKLATPPEQTGAMKIFFEGILASGYILPIVKLLELITGILLISGFFIPLALVLLAPIVVNIFFIHLLLDPSGLVVGIFLVLSLFFLAYRNKSAYQELFKPKQ